MKKAAPAAEPAPASSPAHSDPPPDASARRRPILESVTKIYAPAVYALWVVLVIIVLRFVPPLLSLMTQLTQAITRASIALEHVATDAGASRESTGRIELTTGRIEATAARTEAEIAAIRVQLAELRGTCGGK